MIVRQVLFWVHLVAGVIAGLAIGVMCFTGTTLAFQKQLIDWADADARRIAAPAADAPRLSLEELARRLRENKPGARPTAIVVSNDARSAVAFSLGRDATLYVNPFTGEIAPAPTRVRSFLRSMEDWHRWLGRSGDHRPIGKTINGVCNAAFLLLAVTGLYLWFPRSWSWRSVRAVSLFNWRLTGRARDFNWHNTIGLWCAPALIILTLTALPMSFQWANALIYKITRSQLPPVNAGGGAPALQASAPTPDAAPLSYEALIDAAQKFVPKWSSVTIRLPAGDAAKQQPGRRPAVSLAVRPQDASPRFETVQVTLNPYTGGMLRFENYSGASKGRKMRSWSRFLHTGEALGIGGQFVAGVASLGGCFLVYTGFALAARRFFGRRLPAPGTPDQPRGR